MIVEEAMTGRYSCRAFLPKPVPRELIERILQIAARAPSGSNIQPWKVIVGDAALAMEGLSPAHTDAPLTLAIRPHEIELYPQDAGPGDPANVMPGTVTRQSFLGDTRDYLVSLGSGQTVRVSARPELRVAVGDCVWLRLPPAHCKLLE